MGSNPTPCTLRYTPCCFNEQEFYSYLLGNIRAVTAESYVKRVRRLGKIADLNNPEKIKAIICTYQSRESYKELLTNAYDYYVKFKGLSWVKPRFSRQDTPIYLPLESEIDMLISHSRGKMSVFLQLLKETGADSGEAWQTRWIDLNAENRTISIRPTKNHNARTLPISANLIARIYELNRNSEFLFGGKDLEDFRNHFTQMRTRVADKLDNVRFKQVSFRSIRHWKATMEYHRTKDILHVKWLLGHKRIENTLVYTHLVHFQTDDFACRIAKSIDEATSLIEAGFEYVTEMEGIKLFRKRK